MSSGGRLSRRDFVALSVAAGLGSAAAPAVLEREVEIETSDGRCDAVLFHPRKGSHPGVLVWHDSGGLRPAFREIGRKLAGRGYAVLVPNLFYRAARAPVFPDPFDPPNNKEHMALYRRITATFFTSEAADRDATAYVGYLDTQRQVDKRKRIGVQGYCLGGPYVLRTAAALPARVGAGASFHGGLLVTDKPDSPHRLAPKLLAPFYFAIASDDDQREPHVKDALRQAFAASRHGAEVEVFEHARHGFCVPDSRAAAGSQDAARAWAKLLSLYKRAL